MRNVILLLFILILPVTKAQKSADPIELFKEGQFFFVRKDYKEALYFFKELIKTNENNSNFNFKLGECYLNIPGQEHLAVPYFEKSSKKIIPKKEYRSKDYNETSAPLHSFYYLGNAYRMAGELESALKAYNKFIDSPFFYGNYNLNVVEVEIKSCERAKIIQDSPIDINKTLIKAPIASLFSEYNPVLSHNANKLVFVRGLKFYEAIFVSTNNNGEWTKPININPEIGSDGDFYPTGMNSDGTTILFTRIIEGNSDIYISEYDSMNWSKARKISGKINSLANETFASFGEDDETIYFVSDRQRGKGGKDIWVSKKSANKGWGKPQNLGKEINTEFDEETPVICRQDKTLFFSSKGHYNMGGYDIFYSNMISNEWSIPRNIGYPLNTTHDDLFYTVKPKCNTGYYSIIDSKSGIADIYLIELNSVLAIPKQQYYIDE